MSACTGFVVNLPLGVSSDLVKSPRLKAACSVSRARMEVKAQTSIRFRNVHAESKHLWMQLWFIVLRGPVKQSCYAHFAEALIRKSRPKRPVPRRSQFLTPTTLTEPCAAANQIEPLCQQLPCIRRTAELDPLERNCSQHHTLDASWKPLSLGMPSVPDMDKKVV